MHNPSLSGSLGVEGNFHDDLREQTCHATPNQEQAIEEFGFLIGNFGSGYFGEFQDFRRFRGDDLEDVYSNNQLAMPTQSMPVQPFHSRQGASEESVIPAPQAPSYLSPSRSSGWSQRELARLVRLPSLLGWKSFWAKLRIWSDHRRHRTSRRRGLDLSKWWRRPR